MQNCNATRDHGVTGDGYHARMAPFHRDKHFIRQWREYRGYSLRQLAELVEQAPGVPLMSHANIGRIETGQQAYTQDFLEGMARALGVDPADLLTRDPTKEGEVVDLVRVIRERNDPTALQILRALAGDKSA